MNKYFCEKTYAFACELMFDPCCTVLWNCQSNFQTPVGIVWKNNPSHTILVPEHLRFWTIKNQNSTRFFMGKFMQISSKNTSNDWISYLFHTSQLNCFGLDCSLTSRAILCTTRHFHSVRKCGGHVSSFQYCNGVQRLFHRTIFTKYVDPLLKFYEKI